MPLLDQITAVDSEDKTKQRAAAIGNPGYDDASTKNRAGHSILVDDAPITLTISGQRSGRYREFEPNQKRMSPGVDL